MLTSTARFMTTRTVARPAARLGAVLGSNPRSGVTIVHTETPIATGGAGGGYVPPGPQIRFKTPDLPPEAYGGPSLYTLFSNWYWGKPPVLEAEVIQPKDDPRIDTSGCILALVAAIAKVAKAIKDHAEQVAAQQPRESDTGDREVTRPDPTGVVAKQTQDDLKAAAKDFEDCLRKGMPKFDAFRSICGKEVHSLVDDLIKDQFKTKGRVAAFQQRIKTLEKAQNSEIDKIRATYDKRIMTLLNEQEQFNDAMLSAHAMLTKGKNDLDKIFVGMTKAYTDVVKDSDGLTRVLPSVVKALEACRDDPSDANIAAASKAIKAQRDTVVKAGGKDNKAVKAFVAELDAFETKYL